MVKENIKIQMVDLQTQYRELQPEIDSNIKSVLNSGAYINGPMVKHFSSELGNFLNTKYIIPCANGTDALQLALMALDLKPGDEIITTPFTFVATAEVIALMGYKPVFVDIDPVTYNIDVDQIEKAISPKTKVILPVHLYGQSAKMDKITEIAKKHQLYIVEDNAQAIGATYKGKLTGNFGDISCISFYPSKNLGAYGDAGAVCTNNEKLAENLRCFSNHGQTDRYMYGKIGINSRLDSMQAAVLAAKLPHLCDFNHKRNQFAAAYSEQLASLDEIITPVTIADAYHVFHQYTLRIKNGKRDELQAFLKTNDIPSMVYYPLSLHIQDGYKKYHQGKLIHSETASKEVLSLPIHPNLTMQQVEFICNTIKRFFANS